MACPPGPCRARLLGRALSGCSAMSPTEQGAVRQVVAPQRQMAAPEGAHARFSLPTPGGTLAGGAAFFTRGGGPLINAWRSTQAAVASLRRTSSPTKGKLSCAASPAPRACARQCVGCARSNCSCLGGGSCLRLIERRGTRDGAPCCGRWPCSSSFGPSFQAPHSRGQRRQSMSQNPAAAGTQTGARR